MQILLLPVPVQHEKDLRLKPVVLRILVKKGQKRIFFSFFKDQARLHRPSEEPGEIGLAHAGGAFDCEISYRHR